MERSSTPNRARSLKTMLSVARFRRGHRSKAVLSRCYWMCLRHRFIQWRMLVKPITSRDRHPVSVHFKICLSFFFSVRESSCSRPFRDCLTQVGEGGKGGVDFGVCSPVRVDATANAIERVCFCGSFDAHGQLQSIARVRMDGAAFVIAQRAEPGYLAHLRWPKFVSRPRPLNS